MSDKFIDRLRDKNIREIITLILQTIGVAVAVVGLAFAIFKYFDKPELNPVPIIKPEPNPVPKIKSEPIPVPIIESDPLCEFDIFHGELTTPGHPIPWHLVWNLKERISNANNQPNDGIVSGELSFSCLNGVYKIEHFKTSNHQSSSCKLTVTATRDAHGSCQPVGGTKSSVKGTMDKQ